MSNLLACLFLRVSIETFLLMSHHSLCKKTCSEIKLSDPNKRKNEDSETFNPLLASVAFSILLVWLTPDDLLVNGSPGHQRDKSKKDWNE